MPAEDDASYSAYEEDGKYDDKKEGADYQFFSGSTKAGQNVGSNANHHVSDSTLRGCPCGVILRL